MRAPGFLDATERNIHTMKKYQVTFLVTVELTINNENVMDRVLNNENGWRDTLYNLDEEGVVEMLGRCCGIYNEQLNALDGWADCDPKDISVDTDIELDDWATLTK